MNQLIYVRCTTTESEYKANISLQCDNDYLIPSEEVKVKKKDRSPRKFFLIAISIVDSDLDKIVKKVKEMLDMIPDLEGRAKILEVVSAPRLIPGRKKGK